jgi:hypothetical protein
MTYQATYKANQRLFLQEGGVYGSSGASEIRYSDCVGHAVPGKCWKEWKASKEEARK